MKLGQLSSLVTEQIFNKLKEKQAIVDAIKDQEPILPALGKRQWSDVDKNQVVEEVMKSLDESRKRLKRYEDETQKIKDMVKNGIGSDVFEKYCEEYRIKREELRDEIEIIKSPEIVEEQKIDQKDKNDEKKSHAGADEKHVQFQGDTKMAAEDDKVVEDEEMEEEEEGEEQE